MAFRFRNWRGRTWVLIFFIFIFVYWFYTWIFSNQPLTGSYCNPPSMVKGEESENIPGFTLKQVQVLVRHGDRNSGSIDAIPNTDHVFLSCQYNHSDILYKRYLQDYKEITKKGIFKVKSGQGLELFNENEICKQNQLTSKGILQHILNGQYFRKEYSRFFKTVDMNKNVYILSTKTQRTVESAVALVTGVFQKELLGLNEKGTDDRLTQKEESLDLRKKKEQQNKKDVHIDVSVHEDHITSTHLLLDELEKPLDCPVLKRKVVEVKKNHASSFGRSVLPLLQDLSRFLSVGVDKLPRFNEIVDVFYVRLCHDLGIPRNKLGEQIPERLVQEFLEKAHEYHGTKHQPIAELQTLSIFSQMAKNSMMVLRDENEHKKFVIFSGHDSMVHPFLQVLNEQKFKKWPPYASRVVVELFLKNNIRKDDPDILNHAFYRFVYNGKIVENIKFCRNPESNMLCPLGEFFRYISNGFKDFSKYETTILSNLLFTKVKQICEEG